MEDKKVVFNDSLVRAAVWTHKIYVNKLGYTPLHLVTGKLCTLPGLSISNVVTQSVTEAEAVQRVLEKVIKITSKFREAYMRGKNIRIVRQCQTI